MGRPGPKPKPRLEVVREGNAGKRPPRPELRLPPGAPPEPDWLAKFPAVRGDKEATARSKRLREVARREWRSIVPALDRVGTLATVDRVALEEFCVCVARIDQGERALTLEGVTMEGERGKQRNGWLIGLAQYRTHLRFLVGELGATPSSRVGLTGVPDGGEGDDDAGSPFDA